MSNTINNPLYYLRRERSVHWFLFGVNSNLDRVYFLEVIGNDSTSTSIASKEDARNLWRRLKAYGFEEIELRNAGAIPFHLDQRIREWWKFVNNGFSDRLYKDDPWGSSSVTGNDDKTLSDIAEGNIITTKDNEGKNQIANFWEYREPEEDGSDRSNREDDADDDNYWNKEGVFEYASDKGDEYAVMMEKMMDDPPEPEWDGNDYEEDEQEHDKSYQRWAIEEEKRDEEIEQAMKEYYASEDS